MRATEEPRYIGVKTEKFRSVRLAGQVRENHTHGDAQARQQFGIGDVLVCRKLLSLATLALYHDVFCHRIDHPDKRRSRGQVLMDLAVKVAGRVRRRDDFHG